MKRCSLMLIYLTMFSTLAVSQENKTITIKGLVKDHKSKMPLAAKIKVIYEDNEFGIEETESKADGNFEIKTLSQRLILQAKINGYIVSNILMNLQNITESGVIVEIPLVLNRSTKINEVLLNFAHKKGESEAKIIKNKQVFQAVDAIEGKTINAQFRLVSTNKKDTIIIKTSKETPVFEHNFVKKDTVLVEVNAPNYQKFLSIIAVDTFDETIHENTAKLIKNISFLNLFIKNEAALQNINVFEIDNSTQKQIGLAKKGGIYFSMLNTNTKYKVTINTNLAKEISREFTATEGLNQVVIVLEAKPEKIELTVKPPTTAESNTKVVQVEKQSYQPEVKSVNLDTQTIFFEQSSYTLNESSKKILEQISKKMLESPNVNIEITGHTDNIGDVRQNLYLSEFRAKVISNYLYNKGIKEHRIMLKGDGSKQPNSGNDTEESRQKNRRAELRFY
jgi:outer membrane protein OmpA-like peptidoglycan-associated protein